MELKDMTIEQLEERKAQIVSELELPETDLEAAEAEVRSIKAEIEERKAAEAKREEIRKAVAAGAGAVVESVKEEKRMTNNEIRNSKAYIDAFAKYIKTEKDTECRALLTENVSGSLPVPAFVEGIIRTAWESDEILSRVRRTYIRGNLKVPFELTASPAVVHTEGTTAVTEETLTFGIVTMVPANVKKLVKFSDEVAAMGSEEFIRYVYDEVTYQVMKKLAADVVADIKNSPASSDDDEVGVPQVSMAPAVTTIPTAAANLSDQATNLCVIMNRLTEVSFLAAYAAGNFAVDPFAGLTKVYTSALPAYSVASDNAVYAIVGDLRGVQVNFPEGEDVVLKYDDITEMDADIVRVLGRIYAAHDVTGPGMLCNIKKPAAATT